jgi:hypothetical protein
MQDNRIKRKVVHACLEKRERKNDKNKGQEKNHTIKT